MKYLLESGSKPLSFGEGLGVRLMPAWFNWAFVKKIIYHKKKQFNWQ